MPSDSECVFWALVGSSILKHIGLRFIREQWRNQKVYVGSISRVVIYPVKSLKGIDIPEAQCDYTGLTFKTGQDDVKDRVWMVTSADYKFITARQKPKMVTVATRLDGDSIYLDAPGMDPIRMPVSMDCSRKEKIKTSVWGSDLECVDCGDEVANWITECLGSTNPLRVVYNGDATEKRHLDTHPSHWCRDAKSVDQVAFPDGFPYMLMTDSSVEDLNGHLQNKVSMDHYRPNIVVSSNQQPFDEDQWSEIAVGETVFYNIKPCDRCILTTIDPETGIKDASMESLKALRRYRLLYPEFGQSPCLGINLVLTKPGRIRVGDAVYATRLSTSPIQTKSSSETSVKQHFF